jgi:bacterioferritin-associated ferredoxin
MELLPLVLRNLEKLWVCDSDDDEVEEANISSQDLLSLLSSPSLIDITIFKCDNLTDYIFERASEIHQFLSLEKLTVCHCQYVTHKSIDVVMNKKTPLSKIYIGSCDNITDDDIDLLISNARSEKWELSVGYNEKRTEI